MKKGIIAILITVVVIFGGCNKTINDVLGSFSADKTEGDDLEGEANAVKLNKETRFFNDYFGFSYAIPKNWWLYEVSEDNLSESRGDIISDISMDIYYDKYENYPFSGAWFIAFGNLEKSSQDNHLGFDLDARTIDGISDMAGFMKYFEAYMMEPEEDEEYRLLESQQITIKGKPFELRNFQVTQSEYRDYNILTLICQVKENYFLCIKADYWPDNAKAKNAIMESVIKAVEFY